MGKKREDKYYEGFITLARFLVDSADKLKEIIVSYNPDAGEEYVKAMHEIEHGADLENHKIIEELSREFITPIELADIMLIISCTDDATDMIEEVVRLMYMYNIRELPPEAPRFAELICNATGHYRDAIANFSNFRKDNNGILENLYAVHAREEEADRLHLAAMRNAFTDRPIETSFAWMQFLNAMETAMDTVELLAETVSTVIMKNS